MKILEAIYFPIATVAVALLLTANFRAEAATITWTNTVSGGWNTAANWNSNSVPGPSDTAIITNAGVTVTLDISPTVGGIILGTNGAGTVTLSLAGQTLTLNGPLTVNPSGSFTVDSGVLTGNTNAVLSGTIGWTAGVWEGILTLAPSSTLNITTGNNHTLHGCTFTNNGTVVWATGTIVGNNGTAIYNYGLWNAQDDSTWSLAFGSTTMVFNNYGTFRKSGGVGEGIANPTEFQGVVFNQLAGMIDVENGTNGLELAFQGGGNFTGGYITTNQFGEPVLNQGNFNLNGTVTGTNTLEIYGNLVGTNVINGGLTWAGGNWNGAVVTIASNCTVVIAGGTGNNNIIGTVVTNYGTVAWASGTIVGGNSTAVYNYGLWDAQSDQQMNTAYGNNGWVFNNLGTFRKSVGVISSSTTFGNTVVFNQTGGVLDAQQGYLTLIGEGNFTGGYVTTNSTGATVLAYGNYTINGTVTSTNVCQADGNLVGVNVISGGFTWAGNGTWTGATVTIASNTLVIVTGAGATLGGGVFTAGSGFNDLPGCQLTNYGTVAWISGHIRVGGTGTVINNHGLWDCQGDFIIDNSTFGGAGTFNNSGTFRKSATSGGSSQIGSAVSVANNGIIDDRSGTILVSGNFTNPVGTLAVSNGATIQIAQAVVLPGGLVTGSGTVQAPSITSSAVVSPGATNAVLTIAGNYTQLLGGSIQFDIGGTSPGVNQSQVNITGSASLDGLIALRFSPGYVPAVTSSNLVLTAGSRSGQFPFQDHFFLLGQNKRINAVYSPTNVVLATIAATDPTNFSLSTVVEGQTFALGWPSEFGHSYFIATKTNLDDPAWTFFGFTNYYSETPMTSPHKFFRLFKTL